MSRLESPLRGCWISLATTVATFRTSHELQNQYMSSFNLVHHQHPVKAKGPQLSSKNPVEWTNEHQSALEKLIDILTHPSTRMESRELLAMGPER